MEKSLFEYHDYRAFLGDYYEFQRSKDKKFSYRFFSRLAGFKSSGSILKVIKGQTNLSDDGIKKLIIALKLNSEESTFFANLVHFNQATTAQERQLAAQKLLKSQTYRRLKPLNAATFRFFSRWYYSPIRELVGLPDFREDPNWVVAKLIGRISPAEASAALAELLELELIERDKNGKLRMRDMHITSGDEVSFAGAANCHRQFLELASESIDQVPRHKRDLSAMTLGISAEKAAQIKALIQEFRKEIVEVVSSDSGSEIVYQLNMQFFPLTDDGEESK